MNAFGVFTDFAHLAFINDKYGFFS